VRISGGKSLNAKIWLAAALATGTLAITPTGPGLAAPTAPLRPIKALLSVQPGLWDIRSRDNPEASRTLCMSDPKVLLQLRHPNNVCSRFVIADDGHEATVQYSCPSGGSGRTTIRVETPRLVQIETQGIADQSPFAFSAEARRMGTCTAPSPGLAAREKARPRLGIR